jgi:Mn-dependent DtxR family transcriptional regulator
MAVDEFGLTQEFLAEMLGVRRAGVNSVARRLRQADLIRYVRGRITVADRAGLEALACECYGVIRREFERLFSPAPSS